MFSPFGQRVLHKCLKILRLSFDEFSSLPDLKNLQVVRTVEKTIDNNTSIFIESPIHVRVQPIDVNNLDAVNKLTMNLYSQGKDTTDFQVKYSSKRLELLNKNKSSDHNDVCVIQVPYQLKVHVTALDRASVHMSKLEGEEFVIKTQKGSVTVSDIKAQKIKVDSAEGEITAAGRLQATNIDLKTSLNAGITCNNIMAHLFNATTHAGFIKVKSCYCDKSHFLTALGNMELESLHKNVIIDVIQSSRVSISGFTGNLKATLKSGEVLMHAAQLNGKNSIFIHEKGKVELMMPDIVKNLPATNLIAEKIIIDSDLLKLGRLMDDSFPKRFRLEKDSHNEIHIVCKNGIIDLKNTNNKFFISKL